MKLAQLIENIVSLVVEPDQILTIFLLDFILQLLLGQDKLGDVL